MAQVNGEHADSKLDFEAIVIGAGFGGLRMLYELRKLGISGRVFESGTGVGGVCDFLISRPHVQTHGLVRLA